MANPTTNYGFVLPTSTDLVTDLPADFDVALQGVDTRLKALQPGTTLGDLAYSSATANTNTRLAIGTTGQVLTVSGGVPAWGTAAAAATSYTLLNTGGTSLSGASTTISSVGGYNKLFVIIDNFSLVGATDIFCRFNADSGSNYRAAGFSINATEATPAAALLGVNGNSTDRASFGTFYGTTQVGGLTMMIDGANGSGLKTYQVSIGGASISYVYPQNMGIWSGSAITSLVFHGSTQNWDAGTVRVYGA